MHIRKSLIKIFLFYFIWLFGIGFGIPVIFGGPFRLISQRPCSPPPGPIGSIIMSFDYKDRMGELKSLINNGADINETFCDNQSSLIFASRLPFAKYDPVVKILISNGANVRHKDSMGYTALHFASYVGRLNAVKMLVENGAEINVQANDGITPLNYTGYEEVGKYLLSKGADPNIVDNNGNSSLHGVLRDIPLVKLLLSNGAKINLKNKKGRTPLHIAVKSISWNKSIINSAKFLIANGADPLVKDNDGKNPLDYADEQIKKELLQFIKSSQD